MKYFIPEWDDRVDPHYDFISDKHSSLHKKDPYSDHYMWELFGIADVPFDGVLISRVKIDGNKVKKAKIQESGIHEFLRLPKTFPIIGDCGAYGYINEKVPPYDPIETLHFYKNIGVNFGVSVDHLVVKQYERDKDLRMQITFENGLKSYHNWKEDYHKDFELLCAVQGWDTSDYIRMFKKYKERGVTAFAFGGLARRPTSFIIELIAELNEEIDKSRDLPDRFHFFGLARLPLFKAFSELENKGVEVTFDSASFLRRAWLSAQNNYFTLEGKSYSAIRIPQVRERSGLRGLRKLSSNADKDLISKLETDSLSKIRFYAEKKTDIDSVLASLQEYEKTLRSFQTPSNKRISLEKMMTFYHQTLEDRPWEKCPCPICRKTGVEVIVFRGNNRNRRRGFHNVWIFYQMLKNPSCWELIPRMRGRLPEINLKTLQKKEKVLVITSCTKEKLGYDHKTRAAAENMYQGRLFKAVREFCKLKGFDYVIISAKYGLLFPEEQIEGYEKLLKTKKDIQEIRPKVEERLKKILDKYDKVVVIAGAKYLGTLESVLDKRFFKVRGIGYGDIYSKVKDAVKEAMPKIEDFAL